MIEYIIAHSPDSRILTKASTLLKSGGVVCIPTDTNWILTACSTSKLGIEKLYKIKKEGIDKHFSLLCSEISMASELAIIDNNAFKILKRIIPGHYTFIFEAKKAIAKSIKASKIDKEIGIRFIPSVLVNSLISLHGNALISTNIPNSMMGTDETSLEPIYSYQIEEKFSHLIDLIIDPGELEFVGPSTIINLSNPNEIEILREGAGSSDIF